MGERIAVLGVVAAMALAGACARVGGPGPQGGGVRVVNGIRYFAETAVLESHPVQLRVMATAANTTTSERSITFPDGCEVLIRAYRDASRSGTPAWDQSQHAVCTLALQTVRLGPGESQRFEAHVSAAEILGDSLPAGRYYLSALLRPDGERVEVPAGEAQLSR